MEASLDPGRPPAEESARHPQANPRQSEAGEAAHAAQPDTAGAVQLAPREELSDPEASQDALGSSGSEEPDRDSQEPSATLSQPDPSGASKSQPSSAPNPSRDGGQESQEAPRPPSRGGADGMPFAQQPHEAAGAGTPGQPAVRAESRPVPPPSSYPSSKPRTGPAKKCVECGSTDTPMWRTHPVHGRGTLCNACGVKLYRQQCKDRSQRERMMAEGGAWTNVMGSGQAAGNGLVGPGEEWDKQNRKRQRPSGLSGAEYLQQQQAAAVAAARAGFAGMMPGQMSVATAELLGGRDTGGYGNPSLFPALANALTAAAAGTPLSAAEAAALSMHPHQQGQQDLHIPGCQFAFRGQLPDGSIEPRAIHDVTITLNLPREPGSNITQSYLAVLDSSGGKLATYHTAEVEPRLEYDQFLNAAVWDSRDGWWLLLPTPDHAVAFQGMMRVLAARKLGMMHPPSLPDVLAQQPMLPPVQQQQQQQRGPSGPAHPFRAPQVPQVAPVPPQQQPAALQQLALHLSREHGGVGDQPPELQRLMALVAQGLAEAGVLGNNNPAPSHSGGPSPDKPPSTYAASTASALPLAHHPNMAPRFAAPLHHTMADPVPAIIKVPERSGREHNKQPMGAGPMPFAAPSSAANLFPGFGGGGGGDAGRGGAGQPSYADQPPPRAATHPRHSPSPAPPSAAARRMSPHHQQREAEPQAGGFAPPPPPQQGPWPSYSQPQAHEQQQQQDAAFSAGTPPRPGSALGAAAGAAPTVAPPTSSAPDASQDPGSQIHLPPEADAALRLLAALQQRCR